jgi:PAS domain S-box-containing protein
MPPSPRTTGPINRCMAELIESLAPPEGWRGRPAGELLTTLADELLRAMLAQGFVDVCGENVAHGDARAAAEIEAHIRRRIQQLTKSNRELQDLKDELAAELGARTRSEEERGVLASIVENSSDFIGIASLTGKAFFLNPAGRAMVGLPPHGPIPEDIRCYFAAKDLERLRQVIMPEVERAGFWDGEISLRHTRTDTLIPVLQHIFHIREHQTGKSVALATVCRDISERRRSEHAASKTQQELAHAARILSMGELTTSIAHEINQPLAAIVANGNACLRWIDRCEPNLDETRNCLRSIVRDANRASDIIRRIRSFSSKAVQARSFLSINDVIQEVLGLTHHQLQHEEIVLVTRLADGVPEIFADRIELQQVVLNLVLNAIESMRLVSRRSRRLLVTSEKVEPASVCVCVHDSGMGVGAEELPKLFDAFYTTKAQGMGLGLSISRRIIESHGGQLSAAVNEDGGLTLSFILPLPGRELPGE